ncbi:MAG TPA: alkaline phosphatase D family protein, partial [Bacteroidia bacterium]|nr:alkaline phosphatase D family protein [Bacteroidia bacterium]
MNLNRREFLHASLFLGFAIATKKGWSNKTPLSATERRDLFPQGVASGDPTFNSMLLWTRRPPVKDSSATRLTVEISTTPDFKKIFAGGVSKIDADSDWTCHFIATDLDADHVYYYRFIDEHGFASRVGRTMTAPAENSDAPVRFTFVSCQCPNEAGLNAYRKMIFEDEAKPKDQQLNFVLHLGDFIYEVTWYAEDNPDGNRGRRIRNLYKFPQGRKVSNFHLPATLEDYRTLYRAYLEDPDLQDARARWPFVCVWDNHEFAWAGFQSQYVAGGGYNAPAQNQKVYAN